MIEGSDILSLDRRGGAHRTVEGPGMLPQPGPFPFLEVKNYTRSLIKGKRPKRRPGLYPQTDRRPRHGLHRCVPVRLPCGYRAAVYTVTAVDEKLRVAVLPPELLTTPQLAEQNLLRFCWFPFSRHHIPALSAARHISLA